MGTSTDGDISYGVIFDECEFPWDKDDEDIGEWWLNLLSFRHSFEIWTPEGKYLNDVKPSEEKITEYFAEERDFLAAHPLPVELVNYCSGDCPMYILAVPGSVINCNRGYPTVIVPDDLWPDQEAVEALLAFCKEHDLEYTDGPAWRLSSYWG